MISRDPASVGQALRLYWVFGPPPDGDWDGLATKLVEAQRAGVTMVQWRDKHRVAPIEQVQRLRSLSTVPFLVNDDVDLARAIEADGVHLGQDDLHPKVARAQLGEQAIIGLSVGADEEVARYDPSFVDYVGTGPLFATNTKNDAGQALGLKRLNDLVTDHHLSPVVAIGGINSVSLLALAEQKFAAQVKGLAVVSAISDANDTFGAAQKLLSAFTLLSSNSM